VEGGVEGDGGADVLVLLERGGDEGGVELDELHFAVQ
jgi:hypothetical protein